MSPARHTTHNPRQGLGSRLVWRKISSVETTSMQDSARAESGARADWQACTTHAFPLDHHTSCTVFRAIVVFYYDNHGSFVYDSPNLFGGPSGSVRTGFTGVWSEPGHQTHLTSLILEMRVIICFNGRFRNCTSMQISLHLALGGSVHNR